MRSSLQIRQTYIVDAVMSWPLLVVLLSGAAVAQWDACRTGSVQLTVNGSETVYALKNDSSVIPMPPGTQCSFQVQPLPLTVLYIYITGTNFTNSTVMAYYEGNTASPIYINAPNPIEYSLPPSATPYLIVVKRLPNELPATFAMKIRGERVTPGEVFYTVSYNTTLRVFPGEYAQSSSTFFTLDGYRIGLLVDCYFGSSNSSSNDAVNLLRNQIFFTNTSYLTTAASIFQTKNGIYPTGQQFLTMFNKMNSTDSINIITFAYKESSNTLWSAYSFSDWRRADFTLNALGGSFGAKVISKIGDTVKGTLDDVNWGSANQLDIYEGVAEINAASAVGNLIKTLNRTSTISANNTLKLPAPVYTFVNRGGSMDVTLATVAGGGDGSSAIQLNLALFVLVVAALS
ncbi:hypothetical protein Y032_0024g1087 [Ancylostoma ceylanicum]|nr:hypothetical protein Y032_0024g1087 [Ancylostoma ceylanicum]